jgi:hypothetical protein
MQLLRIVPSHKVFGIESGLLNIAELGSSGDLNDLTLVFGCSKFEVIG